MRLLLSIAALALTGAAGTPALAQQDLDSVKADASHHKVAFENDQVRIVRYVIPVGDKTANHSHPSNVNIFLSEANVKITTADGKSTEVHAKAGAAAWRGATTHVAENIGDKPLEGILIEPKKPSSALPAGAVDVIIADPKHDSVEFENEQLRLIRYHLSPGEKSSMHGHPDNVQVVLADYKANITTPDGKVTPSSAKAGEVHWRPSGQHAIEITSDKPVDGIVVEMKGRAK